MSDSTGATPNAATSGDNIDAGGGWNPGAANASTSSSGSHWTPQQQQALMAIAQQIGNSTKGADPKAMSALGQALMQNDPGTTTQTIGAGQVVNPNPLFNNK